MRYTWLLDFRVMSGFQLRFALITSVLVGAFLQPQRAGAQSGIVSDDFNEGCGVLSAPWVFVDPLGDGGLQFTGVGTPDALLELSVPAGVSHDVWKSGNLAPRVMQASNDTDFEIEVKFESLPAVKYQAQGVIIEESPGEFLRFDVYSPGGSLNIFAASFVAGSPTIRTNKGIASVAPVYMRVRREGNQWTQFYSYDGQTWTTAASFSHVMSVSSAGVFVLNHGSPVSASPAFTAAIDYFFNTASPISAEDGDASPGCGSSVCGDGIVDPGEECDDGAGNSDTLADACRTDCTNATCGDGVTDTGEECDNSGESVTCDVDCTGVVCGDNTLNTTSGEQCDDGNTLAGDGCSDSCLLETCGNGIVDPGEECDDGAGNSDTLADACRTNCANATCGDGVTDTGEECDNSGESVTCDVDCTGVVCGDNTLNTTSGEQCDDGNTLAGDGCSGSCLLETCGNGVVDPGEECDDGAGNSDTLADACRTNCTNATCGDGVTDTVETCDDSGESVTCDADCTDAVCGDATLNSTSGEQCDDGNTLAGDGCSGSCLLETCGNGVVDPGEECDDGAGNSDTLADACRTNCTNATCGDGVTDTGESCDDSGESATCDADCTGVVCGDSTLNTTSGEQCDDGNTLTGDGCSGSCLLETCGNGVVDPGEECDDGAGNSDTLADACRTNCANATCGDGVTDTGESCDDSGESATCDGNCTGVVCGDSTLNTTSGEQCDDGNTLAGDGCSDSCLLETCGNGIVDPGEECDDGAGNSDTLADACRTNCTNATCGDGVTDTGESCDDSGESATCDADCTGVVCGDSTLNTTSGEQCDDGNTLAGDGCSDSCLLETCGNGVVDPGEECDDGAGNSDTLADACRTNCTNATCGDGVTDTGESCDDSGESVTCDADCTGVVCGDNTLNTTSGEQCDDGNTLTGDGCSGSCLLETCGNGVVDPGEECDDGAGNSDTLADACRTDCTNATCGDGVADTGESCDDGNTVAGDGCSALCESEAPVAFDDSYVVVQDGVLVVDAANGTLANDTDPQSDLLTAVLVSDVLSGSLSLNANGSFTYAPALGFSGNDWFTYRASDGGSTSGEATVFLSILATQSGIVSDDFNEGCGALSNPWYFVDPLGDGGLQFTGVGTIDAFLELSVPAGVSHDVWKSGNLAPRVMQASNDTDFEIEVKFESIPTEKYQGQGVIVEESPGEFLRFDVYSPGGSLNIFAASFVAGSPSIRVNRGIASGTLIYLRIRREGDQWTQFYSYDGQAWTTAVSFSHVMSVSSVGVFGFNHGSTASNIPAYTAAIDYFFNTAAPVAAEDWDVAPGCSNATCGDGITEAGESCDDGGESVTCDADCTAAICGDGTLNSTSGEACDDAGESATCDATCTVAACGNGTLNTTAGEQCDDGNSLAGDGCSGSCMLEAPVAVGDSYTVPQNGVLVVDAANGILANDTDAQSDPLTAILVSDVSSGSLALNADGSFNYTPNLDFIGLDSFTYRANDTVLDSNLATVSITVDLITNAPTIVTGVIAFTRQIVDTSVSETHAVVAADLDGDGDVDVVATDFTNGLVVWYENDGANGFTRLVLDANLAGAYPVHVGDVDGDGDTDVFAGGYVADTVAWYENDGLGGFTRRDVDTSADGVHSVVTGDMDLDGDVDLLTTNQDAGTVTWYENDGANNFTRHTIDNIATGAKRAEFADIDNDGDVDVVAASYSANEIAWYKNDGNQNFTKQIISSTASGAYYVSAADVDGDGDVDVLSATQSNDTVSIYLNDGAGGFTLQIVDSSADGVRTVIPADIDLDGEVDALVASVDDDTVAWYQNDGAGGFSAQAIDLDANGAYGVFAIDMDRDGDIDVLSASRDANSIAIHFQIKAHSVSLDPGGTLVIDSSLLSTTDADDSPVNLVYTITVAPGFGDLQIDGTSLFLGGSFSQDDINNGRVSYVHDGVDVSPDGFSFTVTDGRANGVNPAAGTFSFVILNPVGPLVELSMNDGSGLVAFDSSGNGNFGTLFGPQWSSDTPDRSGFALQFDGFDDYVDLGGLDLVGESLTMALWFKANSFGGGSRDRRLISKAVGTAADDHLWMVSTIASNSVTRLRFRLRTNGVTTTLIASSGDLSTDVWTHAAAVYDGAVMRLYKDGVEVGSTLKSGFPDTDPAVLAVIGNQPPGAGTKSFAGVIDDVRIYEQALSPVEVQALTNDSSPPEISDVRVTTGSSAATIRWATNEPATSSVAYGLTVSHEGGSVDSSALVTDHSVLLTGLQASTTYHFEVTSANDSGLVANSGDLTFQTAYDSVGPAGVISDDFSRNNLDTTLWTMVDPLADSSVVVQGVGTPDARVHLAVASGSPHELTAAGISAPRIMQPVNDADFEIEAKFESDLGQADRLQGMLIEEGPGRFLEFSFNSRNSSLFVTAKSYVDGVGITQFDSAISGGVALYMAVQRQGDTWTQSYSDDGSNWNVSAVFSHAMVVSSVGVVAGNMGAAPAHIAVVDYFFNTGDPVVPEDGAVDQDILPPLVQLVQSVTGDTWAEITWVTDEPADSEVFYGLTAEYELGSVFDAGSVQDHTLALLGLLEGTYYHFQVVSQDAFGQSAAGEDSTFTTHLSGGPLFDIWYGNNQRFGLIGTPQPWVNLLGNVFDPDGITSLSYSLNGGGSRPLEIGTDRRRLVAPGDFNADIPIIDLVVGQNTVVFSATSGLGRVSTEIVNLEFDNANVWPLPVTVDWSNAGNIQDVAQIVDGYWEIQADGVRSIQMKYDRLVALGDLAWTDYEVTAKVTINDFDSGVFEPDLSGIRAGVGFLLRWPGHSDDGGQPAAGVFPLGAIGWYQIGETSTFLEIYGNNGYGPTPSVSRNLVFGVSYVFKMRVETIAGVGGLYSLKVWEDGQPEPSGWDLTRQEGLQDPQSGSVLLVAHHVDASFGNVVITPLGN